MIKVSQEYQFAPLTLELTWPTDLDNNQPTILKPKQPQPELIFKQGTRRNNLDKFQVKRHNGDLLIGLYDGHGVGNTVQYVSIISSEWYSTDLRKAIAESFRIVDGWVLDHQAISDSIDGCVATVAVLRGETLTIANIGDCRALVIRQDPFQRVGYDQLSIDHTPQNPTEEMLVREKGGLILRVHKCLRINGECNITRSFGDKRLKNVITSEPAFITYRLKQDDLMMVLATDGLWSIASNNLVAELAVREYDTSNVAQSILSNVKAKPIDNTTLLCIKL